MKGIILAGGTPSSPAPAASPALGKPKRALFKGIFKGKPKPTEPAPHVHAARVGGP